MLSVMDCPCCLWTQSIDSLSYLPALWWLLSKFVSNIHSTPNIYIFFTHQVTVMIIQIKDVMFRVNFVMILSGFYEVVLKFTCELYNVL